MPNRFLSIPVLVGGTIITAMILTWGATQVGINSILVLLFSIPFVFPAAIIHNRTIYILVMAIFFFSMQAMELYLGRGLDFLNSSFIFWAVLIISAEVIYQISSQRRRADEISHRRALELQAMDATMAELSTDLSIERYLQQIVERAAKLLNSAVCELALFDPEQNNLEIVANFPFNQSQIGLRMKLGEGSMGRVALSQRATIINDYKSWVNAMPIDITTGIETVLDTPLLKGAELIGILGVGRYSKNQKYNEDDKYLLSVFARQAIIAIHNAQLYKEIQILAFTDVLTGINNRRRLFELADKEFLRAQRYHRPFSLMIIDIDYFKSINDRYGHAAGDIVLRWFAQECKKSIRENIDMIGRFGGEEFAILLPETEINAAFVIIERLREHINASVVNIFQHHIHITFSAGIATVTNDKNLTLDLLVDHADKALYKAKEARNAIAYWHNGQAINHVPE